VRIACVGGGPAGLYLALLLKSREPRHDVTIFERSAPGATRGWGVVFWSDLLEKLYSADPESAREIERASFPWDSHVVHVRGEQVVFTTDRGHGIKRQRLLDILSHRALDSGARIEYEHEVTDPSQLPDFDLIVACDGVNSRIRQETNAFRTDVQLGSNKYIWLGTDKVFKSFTHLFVETDSGWIWAGANGIDAQTSTFVVECLTETWAGLGFDAMPLSDCTAALEKIFGCHLDGHRLIGQTAGENKAQWLNFRTVTNKRWYDGKIVLAGDAAHTTHFTIGSGTKLAIEDAIALADNLRRHDDLGPALESYEKERQAALLKPQVDARFSAQWFENIPRYIDLKPRQFGALLRERRTPLLPRLSPRFYYQLSHTAQGIPGLGEFLRRVEPRARELYGRRIQAGRRS
jgi:2-polyprenyl-6-methoxyphenol hydroxylase-like FAD-dependent oxidoreductase